MSRKSARDAAFKFIFEVPFHIENNQDNIIQQFDDYKSLENENDISYFEFVTSKCLSEITTIDSEISECLNGWSINRISKITLAILRLAICEMRFCEDIPYQVSINEAVELSKRYGDDDAPSFINGVLASVIR